MLNEFEIFQNKVLGAHVIWEFSKSFKINNKDGNPPSLLMTMPVIPLCFNKRVVQGIKERNFREGSLFRALDERKDLFSGLQERMEGMATLTLQSVYLGCVVGLFNYDRQNTTIIPIAKSLPTKAKELINKNREYNDIINASKRIGAWFGAFNQSEIMLHFNLQF